jgi:hypothetical protein
VNLQVNWGGEGKVVVEEEQGERTKINHDGVDGGLKLCSPSEIVFDMNVYLFDSKIKICVILKIL